MKTTLQILEETLVLVTDGWCQGDWAHDAYGVDVPVDSNKACCFCLEGVVVRASGGNYPDSLSAEPMARLKEAIATEVCIPKWNDVPKRTKEEVIAAIKTAIALQKRWVQGVMP